MLKNSGNIAYSDDNHWRCRVKNRDRNRGYDNARTDKRRRYDLERQRGRILDRLDQLQQEAKDLA